MEKQYKRGSIYLARFWVAEHSEQKGIRPVLIVSNDIGNKVSPTVIAQVSLTSLRFLLMYSQPMTADCATIPLFCWNRLER